MTSSIMQPSKPVTYYDYRSRTLDEKLRRLYESIDCARLFNTRYLLDFSPADLTGVNGRLALSIACHIQNDKEKTRKIIFDWLIRQGCDINLPDEEGLTILAWLCKNERTDLLNFIIQKYKMEIKYDTPDINGDCPLMHVVRTGNLRLVNTVLQVIMQFGINVDVRNKKGLTPYSEAVRLQYTDIAELLKTTGKASTNVIVQPYWTVKRTTNCVASFKDILTASVALKENSTTTTTTTQPSLQPPITNHKNKHVTPHPPIDSSTSSEILPIRKNSCVKSKTPIQRKKNVIMIETPTRIAELCNKNKQKNSKAKEKSVTILESKEEHVEDKTKNTNAIRKYYSNEKKQINKSVAVTERIQPENKERFKNERFGSDNIPSENANDSERDSTSNVRETFQNIPETFMEHHISKGQSPCSRKLGRTSSRMSGNMSRKKMSTTFFLPPNGECVDFEIVHYQDCMDQLMEYKMRQPDFNQTITYADLCKYYPSNKRIGPATSSLENVRWLLTLKAEQERSPPASINRKRQTKSGEWGLPFA